MDDLERAILAGAIAALRRRLAIQQRTAADGAATVEGRPDIVVRTGESEIARRLAEALTKALGELEAEAGRSRAEGAP
jgi:hypothetical protein